MIFQKFLFNTRHFLKLTFYSLIDDRQEEHCLVLSVDRFDGQIRQQPLEPGLHLGKPQLGRPAYFLPLDIEGSD
jgi:hypothetical protein